MKSNPKTWWKNLTALTAPDPLLAAAPVRFKRSRYSQTDCSDRIDLDVLGVSPKNHVTRWLKEETRLLTVCGDLTPSEASKDSISTWPFSRSPSGTQSRSRSMMVALNLTTQAFISSARLSKKVMSLDALITAAKIALYWLGVSLALTWNSGSTISSNLDPTAMALKAGGMEGRIATGRSAKMDFKGPFSQTNLRLPSETLLTSSEATREATTEGPVDFCG